MFKTHTQGHSLFQLLKRLIHSIMFIAYIGCSVKLCWTYCVATENQGHTIIKTSGNVTLVPAIALKIMFLKFSYSGHKVITVSRIKSIVPKGMTRPQSANGSIPIWAPFQKLFLQSMFQWQSKEISLSILVRLMMVVVVYKPAFSF